MRRTRWDDGGGRRIAAALLAAHLALLSSGCYVNTPLTTAAVRPDLPVVLELNDRGRTATDQSLGPTVLRVEGRLVDRTDSSYTLKVTATESIRGEVTKWGGEEQTLRADHVRNASERRLSRGRTALVVGGVVVGIGAFAATRGLDVFSIGGERNNPRPGEEQ